MDDLSAVQIGQAIQYALCYLSQDLLASPAAKLLDFSVDAVKTASRTVLHCY